jgi:hypothetical protein
MSMDTEDCDNLSLRPSVVGYFWLLLLCSAFLCGGIWMISVGQSKGWFVASFGGLGVIVTLVQSLPNASYLVLTKKGFVVRSLFRSHSYSWQEVGAFSVATIKRNRIVVFSFATTYQRARKVRTLLRTFAGYEGALPDTYGMKADDLASLLNEWRAKSDPLSSSRL